MNEIGFALKKITTEQFAILDENITDLSNIQLNSSIKFGINREDKFVAVFPLFKFQVENIPFLVIEIACHFKIEEASWDSFKSEKEIVFPKGLMIHLAVLAVGTTRGVLHAKTEKTSLNNFIIPTINVNRFVSDDIRFEMTKS